MDLKAILEGARKEKERNPMKSKRILILIIPLTVILLAACSIPTVPASQTSAPATAAPSQTNAASNYADPFAYCAAVGQIDNPDARYTGPTMSDSLFKDYLISDGLDPNMTYPDTFKQDDHLALHGEQSVRL
jgi:hypothetical protein